ncbi:MAG TPA: MopE-related protein, partial [bacterium]|nr:MopE-related protein [bacterium]
VDGDGYTTCEGDCDDGSIAVHPEGTEICEDGIDQDCNGSDEICAEDDNDDDGYTEDNGDCDDTNPAINPDAAEICDGIDNDCDGQIDEGFDVDGDGYTTCEGDCDDGSIAVHPEGTEICEDGIDQDCNGSDEICAEDDNDDDGYTEDNGDCDDTNPAINPSATEVCDGVDNDCDGQVDEGFDADSDGYTTCEGDCDDGSSAVHPDAAEICDDIDNDCDGTVDENDVCDGTDDDQDGFVSDDDGGTDCNDSDASVYPGATEICGDGIDQDCSGSDVVCEACSDGLDNDGDGAIDCADADCLQDDACVDTDVIVPGGIVCDVSIDINADGLPDALDPAFGDADGDGIPDCCTDGNGDVVLINYDSDGDDVPNCREFALSSDPSISDIGFQGGAENFGCSLSLVFQTISEKTDRGLWFMILILASFGLFRIRKARMNLLKPQMIGLVVIVLLSLARPAHALNVQTFAPADAVGSGYGLFTSQTLVPGQFVIGSFFNYAQHPLEIGFTNNNARVFGVVDKFITADLIATVGLFKHVNLTANMPINLYHDIAPTLIPNRDRGGPDLGDLRVSSKIQFLDADTTAGNWGFAVVPFVTAPTGDASVYLGDTGITGGGTVIGEKKFGPHRLYVNAGAQFKKEETLGNLVVGNAVTYGAGYQHQFSETHAISGIVEVQGSTAMNNLFGSEITTPVGARAILQKNFLASRNLHTYVGGGMGITSGYGASDFRVYSGLSFTFNAPHHKKVVEAVTPEENFVGLVYFENDRDQFTQDNWATIEDAADFWKNHQSSPVLVVGHADSNWTNDYNMKLSERRALTVLKSLVKLGVPQDIIKVSYYGEEQPVDTNDTDAGRNNNRAAKMQIIVGEI